MVKQSAESQFRCRVRKALVDGKDMKVRGYANGMILEELKKELSEGKERVEASSGSQSEKREEDLEGSVQKEEGAESSLSNAAPGVQDLHFSDGLGEEMPDDQSGCDDAAPESAEPSDFQVNAAQSHAASGIRDRCQRVDARPAKSLKGVGVGDVVYVASEYWDLMGKHPKGYDHRTRFVIVKQGLRPGFWDLCAKKATRSEPRRESGRRLPLLPCSCSCLCSCSREDTHAYAKDQAKIQSLYVEGYLGHVPASLLSARASPPAQRSLNSVWIDLTKQ